MSDTVSALNQADYSGIALVTEQGLQGMLTLRGDFGDARTTDEVTMLAGTDMPGQRGICHGSETALAWMSPDEVLILLPYETAQMRCNALSLALAGQHALVVNVSDARVMITVTGAGAAEVLAKLAPIDMSSEGFPAGEIRRTRLAQVPAAIWRINDGFAVVAFRSVAQYVFDLLVASAQPQGEVGYLK